MTIPRTDLEALAKVMGGEYRPLDRYTVWGETACRFSVDDSGRSRPGTLESLYAKLDEWAKSEEGCTFTRTLINGSYELSLYAYSWKQVNFEGTELECLVAAVLWAFGSGCSRDPEDGGKEEL